jgi:hypothetical protein
MMRTLSHRGMDSVTSRVVHPNKHAKLSVKGSLASPHCVRFPLWKMSFMHYKYTGEIRTPVYKPNVVCFCTGGCEFDSHLTFMVDRKKNYFCSDLTVWAHFRFSVISGHMTMSMTFFSVVSRRAHRTLSLASVWPASNRDMTHVV